jgi:hypothetical protein
MDGEEERKSKQHRAFHSEIDEKRQEKERAGNQRRNRKVEIATSF